jgi:hypothetical protein
MFEQNLVRKFDHFCKNGFQKLRLNIKINTSHHHPEHLEHEDVLGKNYGTKIKVLT